MRHLLWLAVLVKPLVAAAVSSPYTVFAPAGAACRTRLGRHPPCEGRAPGGAGPGWCNHCLDGCDACASRLGGAAVARGHVVVWRTHTGRLRHPPAHEAAGAGAPGGSPLRGTAPGACGPGLPSPGRSGDLPFHQFAHGPRHPEAADRRSHGPRGPTAGGPAHPGPDARAGPRAPLRQPLAAAPETDHGNPCSSIPPCGCAAACCGASPNRPATISWYAPPAARKPTRGA